MTLIRYEDISFKQETLTLIHECNQIIDKYQKSGHLLSVRQLYYQLVSRNIIPNSKPSYNRISRVVSDGRLAGLISWSAIEDRNRQLKGLRTYDSITQAISYLQGSYKNDLWAVQPFRVEVWIEKASLENMVSAICNNLRVDFFAQRGYNSQSAQWTAGQRFVDYIRKGQIPIVLHLGDHDPSGLDMTEDNRRRLEMFSQVGVIVQRIALNIDQVHEHNLVPNYAKVTDSRFRDYEKMYGDESWELDALDPNVLQSLIKEKVLEVRDESLWDEAMSEEVSDKRRLLELAEGLS